MTKRRAPRSIDAALARIAGQLPDSWDQMAAVTERGVSIVRSWGDPDRREQIPVRDAILLDAEFRRNGGTGAPIFEFYAGRLDAEGTILTADEIALASHAASVIRECGEANAALIEAAQPGSSPAQRAVAQREIEEAIEVLHRSLPMLQGKQAFSGLLPSDDQKPP